MSGMVDGHLIAESLEALHGATECCPPVALIEVVAAEVFRRPFRLG